MLAYITTVGAFYWLLLIKFITANLLHHQFIILCILAHQQKATGVKTKQSIKQQLQRLIIRCSLCWWRRPHLPAVGLWIGFETERLFIWWPEWWGLSISCTSSMAMCQLYLWQWCRRCVCLPAWNNNNNNNKLSFQNAQLTDDRHNGARGI